MKKRMKIKRRYLFLVFVIVLGLSVNKEENRLQGSGAWEQALAEWVIGEVSGSIMPISEFYRQYGEAEKMAEEQTFFLSEFPIMVQAMADSGVDNLAGEEDIYAAMLAENAGGNVGGQKTPEENSSEGITTISVPGKRDEAVAETVTQEVSGEVFEDVTGMENTGFVKAVKTNSFDFESLLEYQTLVSTFYTIDAGTTAGSNELNLEKFMAKDMTISKEDPGPQILIYHTHSLESFADSVPGERSQTIVGVGDRLAEILTEEYGYSVLHHTEEYDTTRDDAYANSLPGIQKVLEENPSIQVVIDLHRDAGVEGVHRAIEVNGKSTATFMLFNGLSRTRKTGDIDYLYNPYLADNLAFSFQMQVKAGEYYPGLTRKIYLKAYRYNMHLVPKTLLIELGDSNNTVEEAMNTCDPLAHVLDMVLSGEG